MKYSIILFSQSAVGLKLKCRSKRITAYLSVSRNFNSMRFSANYSMEETKKRRKLTFYLEMKLKRMVCTMKRRLEKLLFRLFNRTSCETNNGNSLEGISGTKAKDEKIPPAQILNRRTTSTRASSRFLPLLPISAYL